MTEMDKNLRKYITDLLKYSENSGVFNPDFTTQEIPKIFSGWGEDEFNRVHHGIGEGCCTIIGAGRYKINIAHCNRLQNEITRHHEIQNKLEELKTPHSWSFRLLVLSVIFAFVAAIAAVLAVPQVQQVFFGSPKSPEKKEQLQQHEQKSPQVKLGKPKK